MKFENKTNQELSELMHKEFEEFISKHKLFNNDDKILLAISGGVDSMFMLNLFLETGKNIAVAHCNFGLRGEESEKDEKFVKDFCENAKVNFYSKKFNTLTYLANHKVSIQMAARQLRYEWFNELCKQHHFKFVATAHHQNDVAETILINIVRGTGIMGLHGILPKKEQIIRPILFASKTQIIEYAKLNNFAFREDESNLKDDYLRNKIRHQIIPKLEELNPNIASNFFELSNRVRNEEFLLQLQMEELKKEYVFEKNGQIFIDLKITKHFLANHILYKIVNEYGFNEEDVYQIIACSKDKVGSIFYAKSHTLLVDRTYFIIKESVSIKTNTLIKLKHDKETLHTPYYQISFESINSLPEKFEENVFYFNKDLINSNLSIKSWEKGDKFVPLGMKNKKLVSDYLIDKKINQFEKQKCLVVKLEESGEIIAVLPYQISNNYKLGNNTKNILKITITKI